MESVGIWPERCDKCNLLLGAGEGSEVRSRKGKDEVRGRGMTPAIGQEWFHPNPYGTWVPVLLHNRGFGRSDCFIRRKWMPWQELCLLQNVDVCVTLPALCQSVDRSLL